MRLLSGDTTSRVPYAWIISVICEAFHCTPSVAEAELERDNAREEPLLFDVLDLRSFADAKREFDAATQANRQIDSPTPMMRSVMLLEYRLMRERKGLDKRLNE